MSNFECNLSLPDSFAQLQLNGATYQSERQISAGGVGRNIAEGIQRMAGNVNFISAVGKDPSSQLIRDSLAGAALYLTESAAGQATCNCSVIFDQAGDCKLIIGSDMDIFNNVTPEFVSVLVANLFLSSAFVINSRLCGGLCCCCYCRCSGTRMSCRPVPLWFSMAISMSLPCKLCSSCVVTTIFQVSVISYAYLCIFCINIYNRGRLMI